MRTRAIGLGVVGLVLLISALAVLALQVDVRAHRTVAACGAPLSVLSGRADWEVWYAQDLADPRLGSRAPLVRTEGCPTAVNRRIGIAAGLGTIGAVVAAVAVLSAAGSRRRRSRHPLRTPARWVTAIGVALTVAGLVALVLVLANPAGNLFLYVDRWVVAVIGLIVLVPAIALAAGGWALTIVADAADREARSGGGADAPA